MLLCEFVCVFLSVYGCFSICVCVCVCVYIGGCVHFCSLSLYRGISLFSICGSLLVLFEITVCLLRQGIIYWSPSSNLINKMIGNIGPIRSSGRWKRGGGGGRGRKNVNFV